MTIYVGINPYFGELSYYDVTEEITVDIKIDEIKCKETEKVVALFEKIKTKINGRLGCVCICAVHEYGKKIRGAFIEEGFKCGFRNVKIIDFETACYLNAMSQVNYKPVNGNVIWINRFTNFDLWEISDDKAKLLDKFNVCTAEDFERTLNYSKWRYGDPTIMLYEDILHKTCLNRFPDTCQIFEFKSEPFCSSKAALLKAQIADGDKNLAHVDAVNVFPKNATLINRDRPRQRQNKARVRGSKKYKNS